METLLPLLIQLASGALGGNLAGSLRRNLSLGTLGNSIAGAIGGGLGGTFIGPMLTGGAAILGADGTIDLPALLALIASGGAGGGALTAIAGLIRSVMATRA
jgi:hypothetical protein